MPQQTSDLVLPPRKPSNLIQVKGALQWHHGSLHLLCLRAQKKNKMNRCWEKVIGCFCTCNCRLEVPHHSGPSSKIKSAYENKKRFQTSVLVHLWCTGTPRKIQAYLFCKYVWLLFWKELIGYFFLTAHTHTKKGCTNHPWLAKTWTCIFLKLPNNSFTKWEIR